MWQRVRSKAFGSERANKPLVDSSNYDDDYQWLYFFQSKRVEYIRFVGYIHKTMGSLKSTFSLRPCLNVWQPDHVFKNHGKSEGHKKLEAILLTSHRSSRPEVFLSKGALKICSKFTGGHLCRSTIY